ncbi:MAG TPA: DUF1206 domain-containing protein [Deinococcales bacterium]|nr:DUF1206 domain-containing protein [Deinococcales bacterium]
MNAERLKDRAEHELDGSVRRAAPAIEWLARIGFAMKGLVYGVIGVLALQVALNGGGRTTDTRGAIQILGGGPAGQVLLALAGAGLIGYGLWRLLEGILDLRGKGSEAKGLAKRAGYAVSGLVNGGLGVYAIQLLRGSGSSGGGENSTDRATATALALPLGQVLVVIAGIAIAVFGITQVVNAFRPHFRERFRREGVTGRPLDALVTTGRLGTAGRSVIFVVVGILLVRAGILLDPGNAVGLQGALGALQQAPAGQALLAATAVGFVLYAVFCILQAVYRRINLPGGSDHRRLLPR